MYSYPILYQQISHFLNRHQQVKTILKISNKLITRVMAISYPIVIIGSILNRVNHWPLFIIVPAIAFILVTVIRKQINAKRPYEIYAIDPIEKKDKVGESFPSRHVFSASMIAMVIFSVNHILGIFYLGLALILALIRVMLGVHFPRDVLAGFLIGIFMGLFLT